MNKPKKNLVDRPRASLAVAPPVLSESDSITDSIVRLAEIFGFKQVLISPVAERQDFFKNPKFLRHYGQKVLEVLHPEKELILVPTNLHGIFKRYSENVKARGPHVAKWFCIAPLLENSNDGKQILRHEVGLFILGDGSALAHAQLVSAISRLFSGLGVLELNIELNSLGCENCQKGYQNTLEQTLEKSHLPLCDRCTANLNENPLAMWTCENVTCQTLLAGAPQMVDFLDDACRQTFIGLLETLDALGIAYNMNSGLVGSRITENIVFQALMPGTAPLVSLGEGGDYSSWSGTSEEEVLPLLGFVTTLEKIWDHIPEEKRNCRNVVEVFLVSLGQIASRKIMGLQRDLQLAGVSVAEAMLQSSGIKNQLKEASDHKSEIALIIGQKEALDDTVILRDMRSGMQEVFAHDRIIEEVKKRLGK